MGAKSSIQPYCTIMFQIRNLDHRNINPLVGACIDPMKTSILTVYCPKGSLQDVLENDTIKLDQIFKVSFATDIAKVCVDLLQ